MPLFVAVQITHQHEMLPIIYIALYKSLSQFLFTDGFEYFFFLFFFPLILYLDPRESTSFLLFLFSISQERGDFSSYKLEFCFDLRILDYKSIRTATETEQLNKEKKSDIKTSDKDSFHVEVINAQSCSSANEEGHLKYHLGKIQPGEFKEVVYLNSSLHTAENPNCSFYKSLFLQLPG